LILLREHYSVRALSQRTGMDVRALYGLYHGKPVTWTVAVQGQLEALVPPEFSEVLEVSRQPARPVRWAALQKKTPATETVPGFPPPAADREVSATHHHTGKGTA
jgi:hypothetical protein